MSDGMGRVEAIKTPRLSSVVTTSREGRGLTSEAEDDFKHSAERHREMKRYGISRNYTENRRPKEGRPSVSDSIKAGKLFRV